MTREEDAKDPAIAHGFSDVPDRDGRYPLLQAPLPVLHAAEHMALMVARGQAQRGEAVPPNTAMMLCLAIDRLTGGEDWTAEAQDRGRCQSCEDAPLGQGGKHDPTCPEAAR